jgi:hypothetical protein
MLMGNATTHPLTFVKVCFSKVHLLELDKNTIIFRLKINKTRDKNVISLFVSSHLSPSSSLVKHAAQHFNVLHHFSLLRCAIHISWRSTTPIETTELPLILFPGAIFATRTSSFSTACSHFVTLVFDSASSTPMLFQE